MCEVVDVCGWGVGGCVWVDFDYVYVCGVGGLDFGVGVFEYDVVGWVDVEGVCGEEEIFWVWF